MRHRIKRHRAAVRPSPDCHPIFIELRVLREKLVESVKLIFQLDRSELMTDRGLEFAVSSRSSAIVDGKNREALARQNFIERTQRFFQNHLRGGTAPP